MEDGSELPKWMQGQAREFVVCETSWPHSPQVLKTFDDYDEALAYKRMRPSREIYARFRDTKEKKHGN